MPRKMRRAALRSALSVKAADNNIVVLDKLFIHEPKTRLMAAALNRLVGDKALILIPEKNDGYELIRARPITWPTPRPCWRLT
jgi:large subunit ribosomal protein L4